MAAAWHCATNSNKININCSKAVTVLLIGHALSATANVAVCNGSKVVSLKKTSNVCDILNSHKKYSK